MEQFEATAETSATTESPTALSQLVVEAVAEREDVGPIELDPLYDAVDPDALDAIFQMQLRPSNNAPTGEIHFEYHGYTVRVTAAGRVDLREE